jgi:hypothetical protein
MYKELYVVRHVHVVIIKLLGRFDTKSATIVAVPSRQWLKTSEDIIFTGILIW